MSRELPKLYRKIEIEFDSLRNTLGNNGGVNFDVDTTVRRKCRRVKIPSGWKWQICDAESLAEWDWCVDQDQEVLDNYESDLEFKL